MNTSGVGFPECFQEMLETIRYHWSLFIVEKAFYSITVKVKPTK